MSRTSRWWLLLILGVATLLRVAGIGQRELWFDERTTAGVITGAVLTDPIGQSGPFTAAGFWKGATPAAVLDASIRADAGNGVLYSLLLHGWAQLAGASTAALRLPSACFGVLTVVLAYAVGRHGLSETGALLAAGLTAAHPFLVRYSQEARSYSLATFLALLATFYFLRIVRAEAGRPQPHAWLGYGVAVAGALLSHYLTVYVFLAQAGWALVFLRNTERWKHCAAAAAVAGALALPWLLTGGREGAGLMRSLDQAYRARAERVAPGEDWALPVTPRTVGAGWVQMGLALTGNRLQTAGLRLSLLLPLLAVAGVLAASGTRIVLAANRPYGFLVLVLALAAPAFAAYLALRSGHTIPFSVQYACFGVPFMLMLVAGGVEHLRTRTSGSRPSLGGSLCLAVYGLSVLASLGTVALDLPGRRPPDPYAASVAQLKSVVQPGDRVVYPSWAVARLCNLHLGRESSWVQSVDVEGEGVRVVTSAGRVRYAAAIPPH